MSESRGRIIRIVFLLLCCGVLVLCSAVILNQKEALYLDEYASYGCANSDHGKLMYFQNGVTYSPETFRQNVLSTYAATEEKRFRFDLVWNNLNENVHPPVFYAALHIACSLTPGIFSKWQAGIVNMLFGLIGLVFFQKFARDLIRSEWMAGIVCLSWVCTLGLYANIVFLRDYAAAACGVLAASWECFRFFRGHRGVRDLVKTGLASAFAVLCHYYCIIFLFFLCAVFCVMLLIRKEWKDVLKIVAAEAGAAVAAVAVFPGMVSVILKSGRGVEAAENLAETDGTRLSSQATEFYRDVNNSFFGGLLPYAAALILLLAVLWLILRKRGACPAETAPWVNIRREEIVFLMLPCLLYYVLICKIAPISSYRYLFPATAVFYLSVAALLAFLGQHCLKKRALALALAASLLAMCCLSWPAGSIQYLFRGTNRKIRNKLEPYGRPDAVIVRTAASNLSALIPQMDYYGSFTFYSLNTEGRSEIQALEDGKDVVLLISRSYREEQYQDKLAGDYPGYSVTELGNLDGRRKFDNYYLHREE